MNPFAECSTRARPATQPECPCVIQPIGRINVRQLEKKPIDIRPKCRKRSEAAPPMQRRVMEPYDERLQRGRIPDVCQRVECSRPDVRIRIVEGRDECRRLVPDL